MLSLTNYHNTSIFFTNYPDWCSPEQIIRTPFKNILFCYFNKGHCKRKKTDIKSKETMFPFKNRDRGKKNIFLTSLSKKCLLFWWWALSDRRAARQLTRKLKQSLAIYFLVLSISGWGGDYRDCKKCWQHTAPAIYTFQESHDDYTFMQHS